MRLAKFLFVWLMVIFSVNLNGAVTFSDLVLLEQGMILRGEPKAALKFTLESDAADTIYSIQLTSDVAFNASGHDITDIELYIDDGDDVYETDGSDTLFLTSTWDGSSETSVIFQNTTGVILSDTPISIIVVLTAAATDTGAPRDDSYTIDIDNYSIQADFDPEGDPGKESKTVNVVTVTANFTTVADTNLIYDADTDDFPVVNFNLLADDNEAYYVNQIQVVNSAATFDYDGDNDGVTDVKLYRSDDATFDSNDTLIAQISDGSVTFNSTTLATIDLDINDQSDSFQTAELIPKNDNQQYFIVYSLGPSTNILADPVNDDDDDAFQIDAQVISIDGFGFESQYTYGPINITSPTENDFDGSVSGMVFYDLQNIFPSMNVAANVSEVPILQFKARSVGVTLAVTTLVISNDAETFATNANGTNGLSKLYWLRDDGNNVFDGIDNEFLVDSIDLDNIKDADNGAEVAEDDNVAAEDDDDENTNDKATMKLATEIALTTSDALVLAGKSNAQVFYVVADFGAAMDAGDTVSLNIHEDTKVSYDKSSGGNYSDTGDDGGVVNNDGDYFEMSPGVTFPIPMDPTQSIVLIDPDVTVLSNFTNNLVDTTKSLIAGMYDIPIYTITLNVFESVTNMSMEFESQDGFFSDTNVGISTLSLYLDLGTANEVDSDDIFLGSTQTFTNSNTRATVSGISLPEGSPQRLLVVLELGQRVTEQANAVSIQLVGTSGGDVAALLPNPYTPQTYNVDHHQMKITSLTTTGISSSTISNDSPDFKVEVLVIPVATGENDINLLTENSNSSQPLSTPKFYLDGVSGFNRTYEFDISFDAENSVPNVNFFPIDVDSGADNIKRDFEFNVSPSNILSEGNYLVDFDLFYSIVDTSTNFYDYNVRLTRSKGAGTNYLSAAELTKAYIDPLDEAAVAKESITATTSNESYSWTLPALVSTVQNGMNSSTTVAFYNYQSIQKNSKFFITFANDGKDVDPASITVSLNGTALKSESEVTSVQETDYYTYDTTTGQMVIQSVGENSGNLVINANDNFGAAYPTSTLLFYVSESNQVNDFLVYPNPYSPSITNSGLTFGFSLTQPADVQIFVYDSMGRQITYTQSTSFGMGYSTITWDGLTSTGRYLASGTYYLKLIATGDEGDVVTTTTKLAVY